ncbi:hypothetical protein ACKUFS_21305 [Pseudomonas cannabina]|uniref:Uncharacterized protein n=2 Tax=Pseudomonas cannabina TaxID=86840 RepID=A0A3M3Q2V6_PSECA|nr:MULTISPECIES: hypothetical protein [Pseudomonas syringae group]KPW22061.1 hypothetical protein ALO83_102491 [Pseudomonas cannabina pv. alisalensis]MBM0141727.1 hypothetical protein [Pseudomonas cannabina pv. alisalensis]QQN21886.1 hypothetical protein JGS08_25610 [Pseudomonas cannabina pv. alisalensis]RMN76612.1 hypothetical protein ALQ52_103000 [Pseudomonas cannabina pv. alisalensis]RMN78474.1 hypothetical protein ALQ53_102379 [Pseudomonas cannabina]
MTDEQGKVVSMKERLKERQTAARRKQQLFDRRIEQANVMALMFMRTQGDHLETIKASLKVADRYVIALRECVHVLGGSSLVVTATFPEGKVAIEKLSQ